MIEDPGADEFIRSTALEVLAYLTATGRLARDETEAYLRRLYKTMQPQDESFVWSGWTLAASHLGLESMSDVVRRAFERGLVDPMFMKFKHFREDLKRTLDHPESMDGFREDEIVPLDDAIGTLSGWYGFSEAAKRDRERRASTLDDLDPRLPELLEPAVNPFKGVGRNDPCPCGSGKKFKKCCLR